MMIKSVARSHPGQVRSGRGIAEVAEPFGARPPAAGSLIGSFVGGFIWDSSSHLPNPRSMETKRELRDKTVGAQTSWPRLLV